MYLNDKSISQVKKILVVGKNNQVGDMICSLPLYAALKKRFPTAKITLVAAKTNYPIHIKKINPHIDRIITLDRSTLKSSIKFLKELRKTKYQIGVVPSTIALSSTSHIISFLSGTKIRVGVRSIDGEKNKNSYLLNVKNDFNWKGLKKHQRDRNLDIVEQIGCSLTCEELKNIKLTISQEDVFFAESFLTESFPNKTKNLIGIHPGAGKKENVWDIENFISLIKKLNNIYKSNFLITAGYSDKNILERITTFMSNENINFAVAENFEVTKLCAVLKYTDLFVTNDTGPMHIAASSGTSILALFGPTKSYEWGPTGDNSISIQSPADDINKITVEEVLQKSIDLLYGE
jgi:ADP-heptose:LPS heptosyltransferase